MNSQNAVEGPWQLLRLYGWFVTLIGGGLTLLCVPLQFLFPASSGGGEWGIPNFSGLLGHLASDALYLGLFLLLCGIPLLVRNKWLSFVALIVSSSALIYLITSRLATEKHLAGQFSAMTEFVIYYFLMIILPHGLWLYHQTRQSETTWF